MHWRTRRKLLTATKFYITLEKAGSSFCHEVRFQFDNNTFAFIDLKKPWPQRMIYEPLPFNVDIELIGLYPKKEIVQKLSTSMNKGNNSETVGMVIPILEKLKLKH